MQGWRVFARYPGCDAFRAIVVVDRLVTSRMYRFLQGNTDFLRAWLYGVSPIRSWRTGFPVARDAPVEVIRDYAARRCSLSSAMIDLFVPCHGVQGYKGREKRGERERERFVDCRRMCSCLYAILIRWVAWLAMRFRCGERTDEIETLLILLALGAVVFVHTPMRVSTIR